LTGTDGVEAVSQTLVTLPALLFLEFRNLFVGQSKIVHKMTRATSQKKV
jgi:hypothetical protein